MPMLLHRVPTILNWGAGTQILDSVVKSVPILVVNHLAPSWYHVVQVRHDLMQRDAKAGHIAIFVHMPARPRQLQPGIAVQYEFVGFPI